jgi:hypothetical protein
MTLRPDTLKRYEPDPNYEPSPEELEAYETHDIMTLEEFWGAVSVGVYIDYDGYGYAGDGVNFWPEHIIAPSTPKHDVPAKATHIKWFNK